MTHLKTAGRKLPNADEQSAIAQVLIAKDKPSLHSYKLKGGPTVHFAARHADCMSILRTGEVSDHLSAGHYDHAMQSATGDLDFLLGKGEDKTARWEILRLALNMPPAMDRRDGTDFAPYAKMAVRDAVKDLRRTRDKEGRFDGIEDFAQIAAALAAARFTGVRLPKDGQSLRAQAKAFMRMSQMVFGQAFANVGDRSVILRGLARLSTWRFRRAIAKSVDDPLDGSLLARINAVRATVQTNLKLSDETFERHRTALVYEISGTIQILVTASFANLIDSANRAGLSPADLNVRIGAEGFQVIDEALRLVPTTPQIFRRVITEFSFGGTTLAVGDLVCAMVGPAMRDPSVFVDPKILAELDDPNASRRWSDYLNFGPNQAVPNAFRPTDGAHPCFGQYWARHLLAEMIKGLASFEAVQITAPVERLLGLPAKLPMIAPPDAAEQTADVLEHGQRQALYTVLSEIRPRVGQTREEAEGSILKMIEALGLATDNADARVLRETNCIHFGSLTVVAGRKRGEPSYLVLEFSADGMENHAITSLCTAFSEALADIYIAAGAIKREGQLRAHLLDNSVELVQSPWPSFLSGKARNGLGFNGTPGLSQPRIRAEAILSDKVRELLTDGNAPARETPLQSLQRVRETLEARRGPDREMLWPMLNSSAPVFAENRRSPWVTIAKASGGGALSTALTMAPKMFPRPLIPWFGLAFLAIFALVHAVIFQKEPLPCGPSCVRLPPWLGDSSPTMQPFTFLISPTRLMLTIGAAVAVAMAFNIFGAGLRRALRPIRSFGFARMGSVVWFSAAFMALTLLISAHHVWGFIKWPALDRPDLAAFAFDNQIWSWVLSISGIILIYAALRRGLRKSNLAFATLGTIATVTIFALVVHQQWIIFSDGLDGYILNRWGQASLFTLIFYPLILAAGLVIAALGLIRSWPALDAARIRVSPLTAGVFLAAAIFVTTFFTKSEVTNFLATWRDWGVQFVLIPGLIASIIGGFYAWLSRGVSGRRSTPSAWIATVAGLSVGVALLIAAPRWANVETAGLLISFGLSIPIYLLIIGIALGGLVSLIRWSEKRNVFTDQEPNSEMIAKIMARENQAAVQNHMASVVRIIPSPFRKRITLPLALRIVLEGLSNQAYRPGFLGSVGTVQYARWIHLPRTNNYVFYSNYDGSFESYLEDFITKASFGMTGVWSNSVGFPETKLLFMKGSEDGDRFKRYARGSMIPTPFWFSAYPNLSAEQIRRNALIRDGLARVETASDAAAWLDLFGSVSRPETVIEDQKVQTIMFSGSGKLKEGACVIVIPSKACTPDDFRAWMCSVNDTITYGDTVPKQDATYLSLGKVGLDLLGLGGDIGTSAPWTGSDEHLGGMARTLFPPAFALGMHHASRHAVLGDEGEDGPSHWDWGNAQAQPAAALFIYGRDEAAFQSLLNEHLQKLTPICTPKPAQIIRFQSIAQPDAEDPKTERARKEFMREPFGFADGISQPKISGTSQVRGRRGAAKSIHRVEPGEFILGYRDNRELFPPSPQIEALRDVADDLPACANDQPLRYPHFSGDASALRRDLGRNGSFLVIRQLEQDVDLFHSTTLKMAKDLCPHMDTFQAANALQAKMVGRWKDGQSLEQNPIRVSRGEGGVTMEWRLDSPPEVSPDNEFLFASDDPQGELCPFGSHIRRANPRDGLDPDNADSLAIANRHRLLRRGRSYSQMRDNRKAVGTFFVCLNADIERQFEFVQQSWIGSPKFHSLTDEVDPITAQGVNKMLINDPRKADWETDNLPFTIQADGSEVRLKGLKKFVKMRGGSYFFLPSRDAMRFLCRGKRDKV